MDDVLIGYIWWRFEKGKIGLHDCLEAIAKAADASSSRISCESVFALLNRLDSLEAPEEEIELRAREMFDPLKTLAENQYLDIHAYGLGRD